MQSWLGKNCSWWRTPWTRESSCEIGWSFFFASKDGNKLTWVYCTAVVVFFVGYSFPFVWGFWMWSSPSSFGRSCHRPRWIHDFCQWTTSRRIVSICCSGSSGWNPEDQSSPFDRISSLHACCYMLTKWRYSRTSSCSTMVFFYISFFFSMLCLLRMTHLFYVVGLL